MSVRVVIADDHPVVRDGLRFSLERSGRGIEVVGEASSGDEVLAIAARQAVHVFILDVTMPRLNGLDTARELRRRRPDAKILMLSLHDTEALVEEAFAAGAQGYLTKEAAGQTVAEAVVAVCAGRTYLSPDLRGRINPPKPGRPQRPSPGARRLTPREQRVLQLVAEGQSNKEIAGSLGCGVETVRTHRRNLMAKLGLHKQAELVRFALREGLARL